MRWLRLTKPWIGGEEPAAVQRVLDSGWLTEGTVTRRFERAVAQYVGAKHAVAVCNCTVALELCLRAYGVTGNVVVPSFTHPGTIRAVLNAGASPLLCDVDLTTYNSNLAVIPCETEAYMPVSWAGHPVDHAPIPTVEDAACSLGAETHGVKTGAAGTTCFSFHPRKLITTGEGGMVTTNDAAIAERVRELKHFAHGNYKLSDVNSAIGLAQMPKLNRIIARRRNMAHVYHDLLGDATSIRPPREADGTRHTFQTYAVSLADADRDDVIQRLAQQGIETQVGTDALHVLPEYTDVPRVDTLANAEQLHRRLLALPMAYDLTDEDQQRVVDALRSCVA